VVNWYGHSGAASGTTLSTINASTGNYYLRYTGSGSLGIASPATPETQVTYFPGVLSGSGNLRKGGPGTLDLSGANTYTGTTFITSGVLRAAIGDGAGTGALGNGGLITFEGGTLQYTAASAGTDYSTRFQNSSGPMSIDTNGFNINYSTVLDSTNIGGLEKLGAGTLTLSGPAGNTFMGNTTVSGGELHLDKASGNAVNEASFSTLFINSGGLVKLLQSNQIGDEGGVDINGSGGILDMQSFSDTIFNLFAISGSTITGASGSVLTVGMATPTSGGGTVDGVIAGGLSLVVNGPFASTQLVLAGSNTHTGDTLVSGGTLVLGNFNALQNSTLDTGPAGTARAVFFAAGTGTYHLGGLTGSDRLGHNTNGIGGNTISVGANGQSTTFDGDIIGSGGLTKVGLGTLELTATNTYTGATNINQGTLLVNGNYTGGGTHNVAAGGTLGGVGTINALVTGGGLVSPGNSPGILTSLQADAALGLDYAFEFTSTGDPDWSNAAASINDVFRLTHATSPLTGGLFDGDNVIDIYLGVSSVALGDVFRGGIYTDKDEDFLAMVVGADYNFWIKGDNLGPQSFEGNNYYDLGSYTGGTLLVSTYQVSNANFAPDGPLGDVSNGWVMQFTANLAMVPEPSTYALGLIGLVMLGLLAWRKKRGSWK